MDIKTTFATQGYSANRIATAPSQPSETPKSGAGQAFANFADTVQAGEDTAMAAMTGKADAQALVEALAQTELAVEAAVTIRDKVVEAYQEILRMQV